MSKIQSGVILIGVAVLVNLGGRLLSSFTRGNQSLGLAGFLAVAMFGSLVVGLLGVFQLIRGLVRKG